MPPPYQSTDSSIVILRRGVEVRSPRLPGSPCRWRCPGGELFRVGLLLLMMAVVVRGADATQASATNNVDHAQLIRGWNQDALQRGEKIYQSVCMTCHGNLEQAGTLPTSRAFWKEPLKNGTDPYSIYRTLSEGFGQMPSWTFFTPEQRYDVVHYLRETFLKPHNPSAYFRVTREYLAGLPRSDASFRRTAEMIEFEKEPKYLRMDFGPMLFWTLQVASNNIAYKGIAVRLDEGPGGVSKGRAWMLYDHDTMRVATAWTGDKFVDWKGIAFDGSHQTHASIAGARAFVNPVGPGWANPENASWVDSRFRGRDGKPYGPLPREWAHFKGVYLHSNKVVIAYTIGNTEILDQPGLADVGVVGGDTHPAVFSRTLNVGKSARDLSMRIAPSDTLVSIAGSSAAKIERRDGSSFLQIPARATPLRVQLVLAKSEAIAAEAFASLVSGVAAAPDLSVFMKGGPARWNPPLATRAIVGTNDGPFAVDELVAPNNAQMPWQSWMRFGGFDFFPDGKRAAICTWNGDVWLVSGLDGDQLIWKRIAAGLFQPLGVKLIGDTIYVSCRDQIARLHDLNGDDEVDYIESFNNDHQVTEHFHEFAMGLQTDRAGNFYYAKSARHALPAIVAHHGTLLRVSPDGARTEILATGFRAANGVCVNDDGTFFVTDQEGHWTPKNRINLVRPGRFYGNMMAYHDRTSSADADMEQPLVWITNEMDRSPGELAWVTSAAWGPLQGSLLNFSYGTGRIFVVPHENAGDQWQGGVVQLPMADFPTGVMRGRFHPGNGQLYTCGMYAWAGNRQRDGGFYRIRYTGTPAYLPIGLRAHSNGIEIQFTDSLDPVSAVTMENYKVAVWSLKRSENYGSKHLDEHPLKVTKATLTAGRVVFLEIPELKQTWCMQIVCHLRGADGLDFTRTIHNTIHKPGALWQAEVGRVAPRAP